MRKLLLISKFILAKYFKQKPIIVTWQITDQCQSKCLYCDYWKSKSISKLTLPRIYAIIDELKEMGTEIIHFTGGEPLLRKGIVKIIKYVKKKNIYVSMNSNCILMPKYFHKLKKNIDFLKLSMDGPEIVHNKIRGVKCYKNVAKTIDLAKSENIEVVLTTVISKYNVNHLDEIIALVKKMGVKTSFQFASKKKFFSRDENQLALEKEDYLAAVRKILALKKTSAGKYIKNSSSGLKTLIIGKRNDLCYLPRVSVRIDSNGFLDPCGIKGYVKNISCYDNSFRKAYNLINSEVKCNYPCWCAERIESNLIMSFDLSAIIDNFRTLLKF